MEQAFGQAVEVVGQVGGDGLASGLAGEAEVEAIDAGGQGDAREETIRTRSSRAGTP